MDSIVLTAMPIGMTGFVFALVAFVKVVRLEAEVERLKNKQDGQ